MLDNSNVELNLAIEPFHDAVQISTVPLVVFIQRSEHIGVQLSDELQDCRFYVVHFQTRRQMKTVLPARALPESIKCLQHIYSVVGFAFIEVHFNTISIYMQTVLNA